MRTPPTPTMIDRAFAPLLAAHPQATGTAVLAEGSRAFGARAFSARSAGRTLDLQYFIWHNDLTGRMLANDVHEAAERGVRVRILLDDMNARGLDEHLLAMDAHPNIELRLYNPTRNRGGMGRLIEIARRPLRINHRMHNKAWIVDGSVAIVGGRNIGDHYFDADPKVNFRDLDLLIAGPAVSQASTIFQTYWDSPASVPMASLGSGEAALSRRLLAAVRRDAHGVLAQRYLAHVASSQRHADDVLATRSMRWSRRVEVVADPPLKWRDDGRSEWLVIRLTRMLSSARETALVVSPYFIPGEDGMARLASLTGQGVAVGVVTNSLAATDVQAVHGRYARYRERLLYHGVSLHELRARAVSPKQPISLGASLHTKAFVVDGTRGFVGSFNIDPRSKNLNTEMGVVFDDPAIAALVQAEYRRLTTPALSYRVDLDATGTLRWVDATVSPAKLTHREPDAGVWSRLVTRLIGWLPIEPHL